MDNLLNEILSATDNMNEVMETLKRINESTVFVGSGGSKTVATYADLVISTKNKINTITIDVRDLSYLNRKYDNIFIASFSGSNYGVKKSLEYDGTKYLLSNRKTKIKDENLLHYDMECEHSFISIKATIIPMSILLKYYLEDKFDSVIKEIFASLKEYYINVSDYINIFSGIDSKTSLEFLTSSLVESGICVPLVHEKYSYCHGRSTINKTHNHAALYLSNNNTDLDKILIDVLKKTSSELLVIDTLYSDTIINEFYQTLILVNLLDQIAKSKSIDLANIDYDKEAVKGLYYFKGEM